MRKYISKCMILLLVMLMCSACGKEKRNRDEEETIIKSFFSDVYSITDLDYEKFMSYDFSDETDMEELETWLYEKYENYLTEHGFECSMRNNIIIQGFKQYQENGEQAAQIKDFQLEEKKSGDTYWYEYKIILDTQAEAKETTGILFFSSEEPNKIDKITK